MSQELSLREEVERALPHMEPEDRGLIKIDLAVKAFELVLSKRSRPRNPITDRRVAIRYSLDERCIGKSGREKYRQRVFTAYWRLLVLLLDIREDRPIRRKRRVA